MWEILVYLSLPVIAWQLRVYETMWRDPGKSESLLMRLLTKRKLLVVWLVMSIPLFA